MPHTYPAGCFFSSLSDIRNSKITVMGLGLNGGGEASVRFFLQHGAYVTVTDMKTADQLKPTIESLSRDKQLDTSRLNYVLGHHDLKDFESADCVIKNPGIKYEGNKYLAVAKAIETDLSIFLHFSKAPIIAVTGSKGKSSTASAIHYGLCKAGFTAFLGGNITVSPLTFLEQTTTETPVVLELSSWQLADLRGRTVLKPHIAVITKIVPDHQNFYHSMESYIADKRLIYADQTEQDFTIIDAGEDEPGTGPAAGGTWGNLFAAETKGTVLRYDRKPLPSGVPGVWQEKLSDGKFRGVAQLPDTLLNHVIAGNKGIETYSEDHLTHNEQNVHDHTVLKKQEVLKEQDVLTELKVPGAHMKTNALNAALVMILMGVDPTDTISILSTWQGIPHRLQYFHSWQIGGTKVKFYNDSCATVPEAAAEASQSFGFPIVLITGGTDKGLSQELLADILAGGTGIVPVQDLYLLGGTATDLLIPMIEKKQIRYKGPFDTLEKLLHQVKNDLTTTELPSETVVVFSPGATSFGMFINEFDRGNRFMDDVKKLF